MRVNYVVSWKIKMKKTLLFCTGETGSGKSYFIKNILPQGAFYNLKSATTRPIRPGEQEAKEYYFRDESYFENEKFATKLFVNEQFWHPGQPKWPYGVPEFEIFDHIGANFTYDVIQPRYVRQMIDWFNKHKLDAAYNFRILWFIPPINNLEIAQNRQNMPNDLDVRKTNTCTIDDFDNANIGPDHIVVSNAQQFALDDRLRVFLKLMDNCNKK